MRTSVLHLVHAFNALRRDAPLHTLPGQITLALDVGHRLKALLEQYLMQSTSDPSTLVTDIKKSPKPGVFTLYTFLGVCALLKFNAPSTGVQRESSAQSQSTGTSTAAPALDVASFAQELFADMDIPHGDDVPIPAGRRTLNLWALVYNRLKDNDQLWPRMASFTASKFASPDTGVFNPYTLAQPLMGQVTAEAVHASKASLGMMMMFLWTDTTMRLLQWEEASASLSKLVGKSVSVLDDGTIPQAQAEEVAYDLRQVRSQFATYDKELFTALHHEMERVDNELPGQIKKRGAKPNKGESRKEGDKGGGDKSPKRDKGPPRRNSVISSSASGVRQKGRKGSM
mmetsp:Transcript_34608/g.58123  ORF Transcript_34608/g.58123 Transcript_34608/m.58123 type:complete len:342 (+) Transcript_34608:342-1367(+)